MKVANCYQVMRHKDHAIPKILPYSLLNKDFLLDVRIWRNRTTDITPILLVNTPKRCGIAVYRNKFRRRVRMVLLKIFNTSQSKFYQDCVIWIRPSKKIKNIKLISFLEIEYQIRLAMSRWEMS